MNASNRKVQRSGDRGERGAAQGAERTAGGLAGKYQAQKLALSKDRDAAARMQGSREGTLGGGTGRDGSLHGQSLNQHMNMSGTLGSASNQGIHNQSNMASTHQAAANQQDFSLKQYQQQPITQSQLRSSQNQQASSHQSSQNYNMIHQQFTQQYQLN